MAEASVSLFVYLKKSIDICYVTEASVSLFVNFQKAFDICSPEVPTGRMKGEIKGVKLTVNCNMIDNISTTH